MRPELRRGQQPAAEPKRQPAATRGVRGPAREFSYADWLDQHDARPPAPPDPRVRLVNASGKTVGATRASNAERMRAALERRHGPLAVVPE